MEMRVRSFVLLGLITLAGTANAQLNDVYAPGELESWRDWVLHDQEFHDCSFFYNSKASDRRDFVCLWPDALILSATASGGTFSQQWTVYAEERWIPLPGDKENWPQEVRLNGAAARVVLHGSSPSVRVQPGRHSLSGKFSWDSMPRTLAVPSQSGLLRLNVDNEAVAQPRRDSNSVWLGERQQEKKVEDAVKVDVYRLIIDDVPTRVTTIIKLEVAGNVREELIGPALPDDFVPLAIRSDLPARLESDGNLRLQVRPGSWEIRVLARGPGVLNEISLPEPQHNLPSSQIWSYESNNRIRVTVAEASRPVDPAQARVPERWQELPGFRLEPGESLVISERSRGIVDPDNRLSLERDLWLDFNGEGFVFADRVFGEMQSVWRMDMASPYALMSASEDGENLLVTKRGVNDGVELRQRRVALSALGRVAARGEMPVAGWLSRIESVNMTLNLPPGHKLFAAPGVDAAQQSWVSRWKLLDFFLLLIITIAAARLFGRAAGIVALLALTLSLHEIGAPLWSWLNLLAAVTLVRVAPGGKLLSAMKLYRVASVAALLVFLVPFAVTQIRIALYPQLEQHTSYGSGSELQRQRSVAGVVAFESPASAQMSGDAAVMGSMSNMTIEEIVVTGAKAPRRFSRYATNALVQTGPGRPSWRWHAYRLKWSGPVEPDSSMRLVILSPWMVTLLRLLAVAALAAFALLFVFETLGRKLQGMTSGGTGSATQGLGLFALITISAANMMFAEPAHADVPSPQILQQLQQRLLEPSSCTPNCAEVVSASVDIGESALAIRMAVHAEHAVAVSLPGSANGWRPEQIAIDGVTATEIYRRGDGLLWIRLDAGRHNLTLRGPIPPVDSLEIPFPAVPRVVAAQSEYWFVAGIKDQSLQSGSLNLTRLQKNTESDAPARWESSRFPVFIRIEREVHLDLDWRVITQVHRVAPEQGALSISVPLLDGEAIVSGEFTVTEGSVLVSMNPAEDYVEWESTLPRTSPMTLSAPLDRPWKEVWRFRIGSIWNVQFNGVPESDAGDSSGGARMAEFYPRAGESLRLEAERPEAIAGNTLAIDNVVLATDVGARSRSTTMQLGYRSTRGAQHVLKLPAGARLNNVAIDGERQPLRAIDDELSIPVLPGTHTVSIGWQTSGESSWLERTPEVGLGVQSSNIKTTLTLPSNRWVLFARGPSLGPAILYWSELVALILLAAVLGQVTITPLRTRDWLLLGLGFSTFSWGALSVVAVWLLACGVRKNATQEMPNWRFNVNQIVMVLLSISALLAILTVLPNGLLGTPEMHVTGYNSHGNTLSWFADRTDSQVPIASAFSLPMWTYKVLILGWALWLSFAILRWLPWAWDSCTSQGLWRRKSP